MTNPKLIQGVLIGSLIGLLAALAVVALLRHDRWADRGNKLSERFAWQFNDQWNSDASLPGYRQHGQIDLPDRELHAIATGPDDSICVGGGARVLVYSNEGDLLRTIALAEPVRCLTVGNADHIEPGRLYVVEDSQVEIFAANGTRRAVWPVPASAGMLTSIAVAADNIFVADAGHRVVVRYDTEGREIGRIGESGNDGRAPGFIVPSPVFDVAIDQEGMLLVVNPGARRIEKFTFDGDLVTAWGESSSDVAGFFGCCNPAHIAVLGDGRIVTSEKGIPRVKRYDAGGTFECLVASPEGLGIQAKTVAVPREDPSKLVFDIATDSQDRVLVLDSQRGRVLLFEPNDRSPQGIP